MGRCNQVSFVWVVLLDGPHSVTTADMSKESNTKVPKNVQKVHNAIWQYACLTENIQQSKGVFFIEIEQKCGEEPCV